MDNNREKPQPMWFSLRYSNEQQNRKQSGSDSISTLSPVHCSSLPSLVFISSPLLPLSKKSKLIRRRRRRRPLLNNTENAHSILKPLCRHRRRMRRGSLGDESKGALTSEGGSWILKQLTKASLQPIVGYMLYRDLLNGDGRESSRNM